MGSVQSYFTRPDLYIPMFGHPGSGKTAIIYQLKLDVFVGTFPTLGFHNEQIPHDGLSINLWDVGGHHMHASHWRCYTDNVAGFIFVVDSNNSERLTDAKDSLWAILHETDNPGVQVPLLVFANKQDLPSSMTVAEIRDALDLESIQRRAWHIQGTSALMNDGLREGLDWLAAQLQCGGAK